MGEEFAMPVIGTGETFTWAVTDADRHQALRNHGQTLERLRERGGLNWVELWWVLSGRGWGSTVCGKEHQPVAKRLCNQVIAERVCA